MNGALKTNLINDCLSDAVVYAGQHGDPIHAAMKLAVCRELGGTPVAGQPCDFTGAELDRPIAVITESLGSKILFDAARATYEEVGQAAGARGNDPAVCVGADDLPHGEPDPAAGHRQSLADTA